MTLKNTRVLRELNSGDHLTLIFESFQEKLDFVLSFVETANERKEKCLCITDEKEFLSIEEFLETKHLKVFHFGMPEARCVDFNRMSDFLTKEAEEALANGFRGLRIIAEVSQIVGKFASEERLVAFEAALSQFLTKFPALALCLYDKSKFAEEVLLGMVRTHPIVAFKNTLSQNYYYLPSAKLLGSLGESDLNLFFSQLKERAGLEKKLQDYTKDLEKMVEKRTKELKSALEALEILATTDSLTGLATRRYFFDFFDREFKESRRYRRLFSCLMIDIDKFKAVNDTYGHQYGDFVLRELAQILRASVRETDLLGRYGGEEIIILLPETDKEHASILAERLRKLVSEHIFSFREIEIKLTISIGITEFMPTDNAVDEIVMRADSALYSAKQRGGNFVILN